MRKSKSEKILGRYTAIETAGEGGFAKVIHAYDTRLKREVAIKVVEGVKPQKPNVEGATQGDSIPGLAEARAAGKLANANIVTIYDCEVKDNKAYVIEEYVEGITLTTLLRKMKDKVDLDVVAHVFKSVATAVMAAHKENILHLDIKPDNILIGRGGDVKVADFGLATLMDLNGEGSASAGTIGYMPLEQMQRAPLDVRSDEWSLAIVTYEMLTGKNPFAEAKTVMEAEKLMMSSGLVVPSAFWEDLDSSADDAVFKALNVNRDARFASVRQFMSELKPHLGDAKEGKKKLGILVNGNDDKVVDTGTVKKVVPIQVTKTYAPLIDRLGWEGCDMIYKSVAALAAMVIVLFAASNSRYPSEELYVLLETQPVLTFLAALGSGIFVWIAPRNGVIAPFVAIEAMCNLNSAWSTMAFYALGFLLWWTYLGRTSDESSACLLLGGLAGAVGFAPVAIAFAGAVEKKARDAAVSAGGIFFQAFTFGMFGSCNVFGWDAPGNYMMATSAKAVTRKLGENFMTMFTDPAVWITAMFWLAAAFVFALFCSRGAKAFHIIGALLCAGILVVSSLVQWPLPTHVAQIDTMRVIASATAGLVGIVLAGTGLTNRARLEPWLW